MPLHECPPDDLLAATARADSTVQASGCAAASITVPRTAVEASTLNSIGYDAGRELLDVEFTSGRVLRHAGVPPSLTDALMRADSITPFYERHVRHRFPGVDVTETSTS